MKKEIICLFVMLVLTLGLVACGGGEETAVPTEASPTTEEEAVEEPAVEAKPTAEAADEEPQTVETPEGVEPPPEEDVVQEAEDTVEEAAVVQPPAMPDPDLLQIELFNIYADDLPVEGWGKTYVEGMPLDPTMGPSNNGFPPSIFIDFSSPGDALIPDPQAIFTMDVPQGRIFPVAHYLAMYEEGGRDYAREAVSSLQQILDERPQTLDEKLPTLPGFGDAQQGVGGTPTYIDFDGGSGVGFVAGYGQEVGPLLNDTLVYQFVGLTDTHSDTPFGTQYLSFVFPLEANFLSDLYSVTEEEIAAAEADLDAYLAGKTEQINNAADSDFTPDLSAINVAMQTITIGAAGAIDRAEQVAEDGASSNVGQILAGSPWFLASLENGSGDDVVIEKADRTINLALYDDVDGTLQSWLATECLTDYGSITLESGAVSFTPAKEIPEDCDLDSLSGRFLQAVRAADQYQVDKGLLTITRSDGADVLELRTNSYVNSWDEALEKGVAACGAPGAVLLVDNPSGRYLRAIGVASREDQTPMQTGDHFEIGSNSKSFTDAVAVQLQEEGLWSLDDPLSQWLPEIAAQLPYGDQVTLRQMAQNHSGIWDYADKLITEAIENDTLEQAYTHQELADYIIANGTPRAEPGTDEAWAYSSSNFILLGMAIEAATGQKLADLYQERIFDQLGMEDSFLLEDVPEPGTIVQGYYTPGPGQPPMNTTNENGSQMWAAGGIVSTAEDMAKYAQGMAAGSLFQDSASLDQMLGFGDHPVAGYTGYGLGLGKYAALDLNAWGHGGQTAGFETLWAYFPNQETTVVLLTNDASCSTGTYFFPQIAVSPDLLNADLSQ